MTEDELLDQLADALVDLRKTTCADMVPLWLQASRRVRNRMTGTRLHDMGFAVTDRYRRLSAGNQSNYRSLASWRQVVIWRKLLKDEDGLSRREVNEVRAVERTYFTPFPSNTPPYAHSRKAPDDPMVEELGGPAAFKDAARRGAAKLLEAVEQTHEDAVYDGVIDGIAQDLIGLGAKKSLWNTLKAERLRNDNKETS